MLRSRAELGSGTSGLDLEGPQPEREFRKDMELMRKLAHTGRKNPRPQRGAAALRGLLRPLCASTRKLWKMILKWATGDVKSSFS